MAFRLERRPAEAGHPADQSLVHQHAEVRPVFLGVELALHGVRSVVVLAERRGRVLVEDRLAVGDVLLVAGRLLGGRLVSEQCIYCGCSTCLNELEGGGG